MNDDTQLAPQELHRRATDVAGVCKEIVLKTVQKIQGRNYVKVEGWQSIATAHGCIASSRDVERVEGGFRAIGEIRRISDGVVLATAEGFLGDDETMWASRPEYARRAMCQTRAISRACRSAFAHVVVLMDAGLSTTPAEEVPDGGFDHDSPQPARRSPEPRNITPQQSASHWRDVKIHFGKKQGVTLGYLADHHQLDWWMDTWQPKEFKGEISPENLLLRKALDAAKAELASAPKSQASDGPREAFDTSNPDLESADVPF